LLKGTVVSLPLEPTGDTRPELTGCRVDVLFQAAVAPGNETPTLRTVLQDCEVLSVGSDQEDGGPPYRIAILAPYEQEAVIEDLPQGKFHFLLPSTKAKAAAKRTSYNPPLQFGEEAIAIPVVIQGGGGILLPGSRVDVLSLPRLTESGVRPLKLVVEKREMLIVGPTPHTGGHPDHVVLRVTHGEAETLRALLPEGPFGLLLRPPDKH
jgi:Flp pilus assembly protein CpaB